MIALSPFICAAMIRLLLRCVSSFSQNLYMGIFRDVTTSLQEMKEADATRPPFTFPSSWRR